MLYTSSSQPCCTSTIIAIMPESMDLDRPKTGPPTPSSRDPRLTSRPPKLPALRTSTLDKQEPTFATASPGTPKNATQSPAQRPVNGSTCIEKRDGTPGGSFAQAISGLVQASVATAMSKSEKEKLQRRKDNTDALLKKARAHMKFPSTADFFQQATNDENVDMARVDRTVNEYVATSNQMEKALIRKWGTLSSTDSKSEELIKSLQSKLCVAESDIAKANNETARLAGLLDTGPSCSGPVKVLQDRVVLLEKAVGKQGSVLTDHAKEAKENEKRLALLNSEIKKGTPPSRPSQVSMDRINSEIESLKRQSTAIDSGLKAQVAYQEQIRKTVDQTTKDTELHRQKLNDINDLGSLQKKMDVFHHNLTILERKASSPSAPQTPNDDSKAILTNLESRLEALEEKNVTSQSTTNPNGTDIQTLSGQMHEMTRLQAMKDDLQFGDMETIKEKLAKQSEEFQELKDKHGQLSAEVKSVGQNNPGMIQQQIHPLAMSLQGMQRVINTVRVGLHSLEMRYNSLTTEPIVKNMVVAMQELYPSASQLTEQVTALRRVFDKDFLPLRSYVDQLIRSQSTYITQTQGETKTIKEEMGRLKDEYARMEKSLAGVWDRTATLESWPGHQHFRQLQSTCENISNYVDERVLKINEQLKSGQDSDDVLRHRLNSEREHLENEYKELSKELKNMGKKLSKMDTANAENLEATKTQWQDISSLLNRVQSLENSAAKNHEQLLLQFDDLKKWMEDQEPDAESENWPHSPPQKIEEAEEDEQNGVPTSRSDTAINQIAETNPTLALQKKKRPRSVNVSDNEMSSNSLRESTPSEKKKSKKKKKQKLQDPETITLD